VKEPGGHDETNSVREWVSRFRKFGAVRVAVEDRKDTHNDGRDREWQTQTGCNGCA
jgi:hypothetical protein